MCGVSIPFASEFGETGPDPRGVARLASLSPEAPVRSGIVLLGPYVGAVGLLLLVLDRLLLVTGGGGRFKRGRVARR